MTERTRRKPAAERTAVTAELPARDGDDAERLLGRAVAAGLPLACVGTAIVVGLVASVGSAVLVLASGALLGAIALLWASVRTLTGDAPLPADLEALAGQNRGVDALSEHKRRVLLALKDLQSEHALGKIDDADYEEIAARYRQQAKAVMREMDLNVAPAIAEAEQLAREYLAARGLGPKTGGRRLTGADPNDDGRRARAQGLRELRHVERARRGVLQEVRFGDDSRRRNDGGEERCDGLNAAPSSLDSLPWRYAGAAHARERRRGTRSLRSRRKGPPRRRGRRTTICPRGIPPWRTRIPTRTPARAAACPASSSRRRTSNKRTRRWPRGRSRSSCATQTTSRSPARSSRSASFSTRSPRVTVESTSRERRTGADRLSSRGSRPRATSRTASAPGIKAGSFAASPFQLQQVKSMHVVLHVYPVTRDLGAALIVCEATVAAELRDDRIQIEEALTVYNLGRTAWQPDDARMALPEGFTAFNSQASMSDQGVDEAGGAAKLRGTFPPGRHAVQFRWQLPWSGDKDVDFDVGLPPHVAIARVMMPALATIKLTAADFPPPEVRRDEQGQSFLVTERRLQPDDPKLSVLSIGIHDLPTPGPGRHRRDAARRLRGRYGIGVCRLRATSPARAGRRGRHLAARRSPRGTGWARAGAQLRASRSDAPTSAHAVSSSTHSRTRSSLRRDRDARRSWTPAVALGCVQHDGNPGYDPREWPLDSAHSSTVPGLYAADPHRFPQGDLASKSSFCLVFRVSPRRPQALSTLLGISSKGCNRDGADGTHRSQERPAQARHAHAGRRRAQEHDARALERAARRRRAKRPAGRRDRPVPGARRPRDRRGDARAAASPYPRRTCSSASG